MIANAGWTDPPADSLYAFQVNWDYYQHIAQSDPAVRQAARPLTMHLGPEEVLLNLDIQFKESLSASEVTTAVDRLEKSIRTRYPEVRRIFIEAERLTSPGYS